MKTRLLLVFLTLALDSIAATVMLPFTGMVTNADDYAGLHGYGVGSIFHGVFSYDPADYNAPIDPYNRGWPTLVVGSLGTSIALHDHLRFIDRQPDVISFGGEAMPDNWIAIRLEDDSGKILNGYQAPDHINLADWTRGEIEVSGNFRYNHQGWWNGEILMPRLALAHRMEVASAPEPGAAWLLGLALVLKGRSGK